MPLKKIINPGANFNTSPRRSSSYVKPWGSGLWSEPSFRQVEGFLRAWRVSEEAPVRMTRAEAKRLRRALFGPEDLDEPNTEVTIGRQLPDERRLAFHYERVYWRFYPKFPGYVSVSLRPAETKQ
jgi:hypothetical protein